MFKGEWAHDDAKCLPSEEVAGELGKHQGLTPFQGRLHTDQSLAKIIALFATFKRPHGPDLCYTLNLSKVILTGGWTPSLCMPSSGEGCSVFSWAVTGCPPPISLQGGGSELRAKSNNGAKSTRETVPVWPGIGKLRCCFNGTPALITLSGDTLKKKKDSK